MDWAKTTARRVEKHLSLGIWCDIKGLTVTEIIMSCLRKNFHVQKNRQLSTRLVAPVLLHWSHLVLRKTMEMIL